MKFYGSGIVFNAYKKHNKDSVCRSKGFVIALLVVTLEKYKC